MPKPRAPGGPAPGTAPAAGLRILLVEDLDMHRCLGQVILEHAGHRVHAVPDGGAAVAAAASGGYDLVFMDVMMPGMDGIAATRAIRALPGPAGRVPIIALTAQTAPEIEAACRTAGMDGFESKPLAAGRVAAVVQAALAAKPG